MAPVQVNGSLVVGTTAVSVTDVPLQTLAGAADFTIEIVHVCPTAVAEACADALVPLPSLNAPAAVPVFVTEPVIALLAVNVCETPGARLDGKSVVQGMGADSEAGHGSAKRVFGRT